MKERILLASKYMLTQIGRHLPDRYYVQLQATINYVNHGRWMHDHGFDLEKRCRNREQVWDIVADKVSDRKVLYCEFGVASGASIQYWSRILKSPESILHGFDSFEGMPESGGPWAKGQFSTRGRLPNIDDSRIHFFKGWFDRVLPTYTVPEHDLLILNMDADLYSSTIFVLRFMRPHFRPGTLVYFDELNHAAHEQRAFDEFLSETGIKFRIVSADKSLAHVFFECLG